jgi:pimeloyl-ACP methyl ester carboxylesterase
MPHQDFQGWYNHLRRIHPATFRGMALGLQAHDANDLLPFITVPTLVVSGGRDVFVRQSEGARIAKAIPKARLLHLPNATHAGMVGHRAPIAAALVDLWEEVEGTARPAG